MIGRKNSPSLGYRELRHGNGEYITRSRRCGYEFYRFSMINSSEINHSSILTRNLLLLYRNFRQSCTQYLSQTNIIELDTNLSLNQCSRKSCQIRTLNFLMLKMRSCFFFFFRKRKDLMI
jgi:hypothetical protein